MGSQQPILLAGTLGPSRNNKKNTSRTHLGELSVIIPNPQGSDSSVASKSPVVISLPSIPGITSSSIPTYDKQLVAHVEKKLL